MNRDVLRMMAPLLALLDTSGNRMPEWEDVATLHFGPELIALGKRLGLVRARGGRLSLTHRGQRYRHRGLWGEEAHERLWRGPPTLLDSPARARSRALRASRA